MTADRVLMDDWDPDAHWSRTIISEEIPGVQTPLSWTAWQPVFERSMRRAFSAIGALERSQRRLPPDPREAMYGIFYGRVAAKVEFLGRWVDLLPGTSRATTPNRSGRCPPVRPTLRALCRPSLLIPARQQPRQGSPEIAGTLPGSRLAGGGVEVGSLVNIRLTALTSKGL